MAQVSAVLKEKQDPDTVTFTKLWDEFGYIKGYMVHCVWDIGQSITFDSTDHYCRVIGDMNAIPDYIRGKHQK